MLHTLFIPHTDTLIEQLIRARYVLHLNKTRKQFVLQDIISLDSQRQIHHYGPMP